MHETLNDAQYHLEEVHQDLLPFSNKTGPETAETEPSSIEINSPSSENTGETSVKLPDNRDLRGGHPPLIKNTSDVAEFYRALSGCSACHSSTDRGCGSCPRSDARLKIKPSPEAKEESVSLLDSGLKPSTGALGSEKKPISGMWMHPVDLIESGLETKSLCYWVLNLCVGCAHGCIFCYVPDASTIKLADILKTVGVDDPELDWGIYAFVRPFDEEKFIRQLERAERKSRETLPARSNGAILLCSTTDPYQQIRNEDHQTQLVLNETLKANRRRALELILTRTTLNVRILTRSPLVRQDFDIFKRFGDRLLFGMSVPSLNYRLVKVYEPHAPDVRKRIKVLQEAKKEGLNVYVAVAPTYPECDEVDLRNTLRAVKDLDPVTIFMESINIRAKNVSRIVAAAAQSGVQLRTEVYATRESWEAYALDQMLLFERIAEEEGLRDRIHIWPDKTLKSEASLKRSLNHPGKEWVEDHINRVSNWPGVHMDHRADQPSGPKEQTPPSTPPSSSGKPKLTLRDAGEILAMRFDPNDDYLLNGILSKGQLMTIVGPGGVGKSRLMLQLIVSMIVGKEFLGVPLPPRSLRFLVLQTENSNSRLQSDLRPIKATLSDAEFDLVQKQMKIHTLEGAHDQFLSLAEPKNRKLISDAIEAVTPDVVIFDPLSAFARGSLNNDANMRRTCQDILELARHGHSDCATIIVHHALTGKAGAMGAFSWDRASYGKGSKELHSQTRGQLNVSPASGSADGRIVISCGKNSNGREFLPFGARLNLDTMLYELDPDFELPTVEEESSHVAVRLNAAAIVALLADAPLTKKQIAEIVVAKFHCAPSTAYQAISKAEAGGFIRRNSDKRYEKPA